MIDFDSNLKNFMFDMSVEHTLAAMAKLKELIADREYNKAVGLDINNILSRFTLDTFCEIAFGQDVGSLASYPQIDSFGAAFDDLVFSFVNFHFLKHTLITHA